jgi:hypothetical protein
MTSHFEVPNVDIAVLGERGQKVKMRLRELRAMTAVIHGLGSLGIRIHSSSEQTIFAPDPSSLIITTGSWSSMYTSADEHGLPGIGRIANGSQPNTIAAVSPSSPTHGVLTMEMALASASTFYSYLVSVAHWSRPGAIAIPNP